MKFDEIPPNKTENEEKHQEKKIETEIESIENKKIDKNIKLLANEEKSETYQKLVLHKIIEEENLLELAENDSHYLNQLLLTNIQSLSIVGQIRHDGLLFGIDLVDKKNNLLKSHNKIRKIRYDLVKNGLITTSFSTRNSAIIDLVPPLIISKNEIEKIIEILYNTLKVYS